MPKLHHTKTPSRTNTGLYFVKHKILRTGFHSLHGCAQRGHGSSRRTFGNLNENPSTADEDDLEGNYVHTKSKDTVKGIYCGTSHHIITHRSSLDTYLTAGPHLACISILNLAQFQSESLTQYPRVRRCVLNSMDILIYRMSNFSSTPRNVGICDANSIIANNNRVRSHRSSSLSRLPLDGQLIRLVTSRSAKR